MTPRPDPTLGLALQKTAPRLASCPPEKIEEKVVSTVLGAVIALFGTAVTAGGFLLLLKLAWSPWLLLVPAAGVFVVLVGGITISKDVALSLRHAASTVRELVKAARAKNGSPP